jgi:signal recognition particle subunit SRP19
MILVAEYLKKHPSIPESPLKLPLRGLPMPEGIPPAPAVPRGWRINEIVPLHSAAQTGGGVSENMLQEMQAAMTGQEPPAPSTEVQKKPKKDKSKKKK